MNGCTSVSIYASVLEVIGTICRGEREKERERERERERSDSRN